MNDLRWKFAVLVFLAVPICGGWFVMKQHLIMNNEIAMDLSELPSHVDNELKLIKLSGFELSGFPNENNLIRKNVEAEFVAVESTSSADGTPILVVLRRGRTEQPGLADDISDGVVSGLVSAEQRISRKYALKLGLEVWESASDSILVVDVDREYFTSTCAITLVFLVIGSIVLWIVYSKLEDAQFNDQAVHAETAAMVAMQLQIARYENYRNIA